MLAMQTPLYSALVWVIWIAQTYISDNDNDNDGHHDNNDGLKRMKDYAKKSERTEIWQKIQRTTETKNNKRNEG